MSEALLNEQVTVNLPKPKFRAVVQNGGLQNLPEYMDAAELSGRVFVLTDENVGGLYGDMLSGVLDDANIQNKLLTPMPAGETNKTRAQVGKFLEELIDEGAGRSDIILALGGGVVGDLVGLTAAELKRGAKLIQAPTTLLAQVDSSIGGKTGVDFAGKNTIGAFYQPNLIVADPDTLKTLEPRVYIEGMGEVAKYAILDADFFPELDAQAELVRDISPEGLAAMGKVIARCAKYKIDVIAADPLEQNRTGGRVFLNYGHTLGHGLEAAGGYGELLHGEAVSIGMTYAAWLSGELGISDRQVLERQTKLLEKLRLPLHYTGTAQADAILKFVAQDKKNDAGTSESRFVLPKAIGAMTVHMVARTTVDDTVRQFLSEDVLSAAA